MAIQPAPQNILQILGLGVYKWLTNLIHQLSGMQSQTNSSIFVNGLTTQNNFPSAQNIAWSAHTIWYLGVPYAIAAGSTFNKEPFVWWVVGQHVLTAGTTFTPGPTIFPILTNTVGSADITWNKLGSFAIQPAHVNDSNVTVTGMALTFNTPIFGQSVTWSSCVVSYQGVAYQIAGGNTTDPLIYWFVGENTFRHGTDQPQNVFNFPIMTNINGVAETCWNKIGYSSVNPNRLNIEYPVLAGVVWSDNTPGAGQISWNQHSLYYKGVQYTIGAGNTPAGATGRNVYWSIGNNTYQTAALYPGGNGSFLIAVNENNSGTHDTAWNKVPTQGLNGIHMANNLSAFTWDDGGGNTLTISANALAGAANAGAAALPANPVGFMIVFINGIQRKIPVYAV